jgi:multidrug efflux pump subunit AcrB
VSRLFSTFRAKVQQIYINVDRVKAKQENVSITDIFQALQVYLGGLYINDFNYLGRTWHVMGQADAPFHATVAQTSRLQTRNAAGQMVPLSAISEIEDLVGSDRIQRYDMYSSADIIGTPAPGYSSGQALDAMEEVANANLPRQYSAFIFGVIPLIIATGAGAEMRQALGTVVFYGMIGVTFFRVFLTPVFYTVTRRVTGHRTVPVERLVRSIPVDRQHKSAAGGTRQ